jgi:hypothetical protein
MSWKQDPGGVPPAVEKTEQTDRVTTGTTCTTDSRNDRNSSEAKWWKPRRTRVV